MIDEGFVRDTLKQAGVTITEDFMKKLDEVYPLAELGPKSKKSKGGGEGGE